MPSEQDASRTVQLVANAATVTFMTALLEFDRDDWLCLDAIITGYESHAAAEGYDVR